MPRQAVIPSLMLADHQPGTSFDHLYTAYVSTAPRKRDNSTCLDSLVGVIKQTRALRPGARIVVVFDGRSPQTTDKVWQQYSVKKAAVRSLTTSMSALKLIEHERFLHQSVGLWAAMNATSGTPFVFVAQDDVLMFRTINVSGITWRLQHDTSVRYVKLFNYDHLDARVQSWNRPAKPHPTDPTLFSLRRFSDRPHFAHRAIYTDEVWPHVRHTDRGVPETLLRRFPDGRAARVGEEAGPAIFGLWVYAPQDSKKHETHNACGMVSTFKKEAG